MTISARESFTAILFNTPRLSPDAIVVLAGEDGEPRLDYAAGMMRQSQAKHLVISGHTASTLFGKALSRGIPHDRITLEEESTNTREQSVNVVKIAIEKNWRRIMLVASPYHLPRVFLSFLKALQESGKTEEIQLVGCSADHVPWFGKPEGNERTRIELLAGEFGKVALYSDHVASYESALAYLKSWEGR